MNNVTLVVMAAGIGSRFGGWNQTVRTSRTKWRNHHGLFYL